MTTLQPRAPYTKDELEKLYPNDLQLQLVQILMRHGERSPVSPRFQNAGLRPYWPYCNSARQLTSVIMKTTDWSEFDHLRWRRRLETFGSDDGPVIAAGPDNEFDAICQPGELTDKGRETTLALGSRLRHLYVDQLGFMPSLLSDSDMIYLRATPIPRALESMQQTFWGMYPASARTADFPPPSIITRTPGDETLYPNDSACRRFAHLSRAFAERTAQRWNHSPEMDYINKKIRKWMPEDPETGEKRRIGIDSKPQLSGVMDTINSTLAHGPATRLPAEFYDETLRSHIEKIGVEEWYAGYGESREYRALGIGALAGDVVTRMIGSVERNGNDGLLEVGGENGRLGTGRGGEKDIRFALSGCHDTTLAAFLSGLGAFGGEKWPPYSSHIAIELFRQRSREQPDIVPARTSQTDQERESREKSPWWRVLFAPFSGSDNSPVATKSVPAPEGIGRKPSEELTKDEREKLEGYYVRIRYNDRVLVVPGCKTEGNHLDGDESFCTLEAFKAIVDKYTPKNWKAECASRIDAPAFPEKPEPAGY